MMPLPLAAAAADQAISSPSIGGLNVGGISRICIDVQVEYCYGIVWWQRNA